MRIENFSQIANAYRSNRAHSRNAEKMPMAREEYSPSGTAKDYHTALRAVKTTPDMRQSRIDEITAGLNSGTYHVSAERVADAILG
ncbi:MAG: flagellar biosynthesis anti-sigma factor FlgM [Defluviitaleaceae bacterium]|nr:flagellar biosynthesis anti-sigma factor FlgM [Defluviitaleaceae bacterium]